MTDWTYLDNAASTPLHPDVLELLPDLHRRAYVNPSAGHPLSSALRRELQRETAILPLVCGAEDAQVVWTSGGTEANNLAISGAFADTASPLGRSLISTPVEHPSIEQPLLHLARQGAELNLARVDEGGKIDLGHFAELLNPGTQVVAVGLVQGETGVIQDLVEIRRLLDANASPARLHVDAVQAITKVPIPWAAARIDSLSISAHKFHGPGGVGALLLRRGLDLTPSVHGGGQQENLRSGSLDGVGILACCHTLRVLREDRDYLPRIEGLNRQLRKGLASLAVCPEILSPVAASPFILNFSFPGYEGAVLMRLLGLAGVIVATGSACSAQSAGPSEILTAMGLTRKTAFGALRVSFGWQNRPEDVDRLLSTLETVLRDY